MVNPLDVLVIGAGQAGLAAGYWLRDNGLSFALLDGEERVGEAWRRRYESLVLFTPRRYSALPGLGLSGDPDGYPTKDDMADYLERYAAHFSLPVHSGRVARLERLDGGLVATTACGTRIIARAVIVATGAFQAPAVPGFASRLGSDIAQFTPNTYRRPDQVQAGRVLVIGDGATGRQIALDLAPSHQVLLAGGKKRNLVPQRLLGRDLFVWLDRLGLMTADRDSAIGRLLRARDPLPGKAELNDAVLTRGGIELRPRVAAAAGHSITFADGQVEAVDSVIWALGYRDDTSWMAIPEAKDERGFVQDRGRTPVPGLFHLGRSWQTSRGSALVLGVGRDARDIVSEAVRHARSVGRGRTRGSLTEISMGAGPLTEHDEREV